MPGRHSRIGLVTLGLLTVMAIAPKRVATQEQFQFVVSARDAQGHSVIDLKREEVVMSENGVANEIVKIEPFHIPTRLTIAVDNGILSHDGLSNYRAGLEAMVKALPPDVEVAVISMAPQPRTVQAFTTDRTKVVRGISAFAPEQATPRFVDTIVEYSKRLRDEFTKAKRADTLPILVLVSTTAPENSSYRATEIDSALQFLQQRKARVYATMTLGQGANANQGQQQLIAAPLAKGTRGKYQEVTETSRLATLLPEWGAEIAALHQQHYNQFLVTATRKVSGPLQDPRVELTRPNVTGLVSVDGLP